jgi:hypothetical protein
MNSLFRSAWLACFVVMLSLVAPPEGAAQTAPKLYSVKFICGRADGQVLAMGAYTTAINIQNPNHDPGSDPITFRKKYSVALPGETVGGTTDFIDGNKLGPGEAFEIDCPDIQRAIRGLCPSGFCKGFVTLEGSDELEVVAVYSAGNPQSNVVQALHTERVTDAARCPVRTETIPSQNLLFIPNHVRGDREFDGNGPCVRFSLDLRTQDAGTTLLASYFMQAFECSGSFTSPEHDFTAAEEGRETVLYSAGPGSRILGYNVANSMDEAYIDNDHSVDSFSYGASSPVASLDFTGDTSGSDAGTKTGVQIQLSEIQLKLEDCAIPQAGD